MKDGQPVGSRTTSPRRAVTSSSLHKSITAQTPPNGKAIYFVRRNLPHRLARATVLKKAEAYELASEINRSS
jgi:hypothetical protein